MESTIRFDIGISKNGSTYMILVDVLTGHYPKMIVFPSKEMFIEELLKEIDKLE